MDPRSQIERGEAGNGQEALRPRAGGGHRLVSDKPTSVDPRAACRTGYEDTGPPCLLRHIGQLSTTQLVPKGCKDLAEVAVATREPAPMGSVHWPPKAPPSASSPDHPPLHCRERSSPVKNRMLEIGTSGSVRREAGNILTYSAMLVVGLARQKSLRKLPCPVACHKGNPAHRYPLPPHGHASRCVASSSRLRRHAIEGSFLNTDRGATPV
jgi:hypothetical protein